MQHAIHSHCMHVPARCIDDARLSQAYRYIVGANSWLQKGGSAQQIAESLDDVFSLSSFRNAQWNQWLSLKVQVQPVLRCVLACGRSLRFRQGKKETVCRLCRKALVYKVGTASRLMKHLSGAHAIQWQARQIKEWVCQRGDSKRRNHGPPGWMCLSRK